MTIYVEILTINLYQLHVNSMHAMHQLNIKIKSIKTISATYITKVMGGIKVFVQNRNVGQQDNTEVWLKSLSQSQVVHLSYEWSWANITAICDYQKQRWWCNSNLHGVSSVWPYICLPKRPEESCMECSSLNKHIHNSLMSYFTFNWAVCCFCTSFGNTNIIQMSYCTSK